MVADLPLPAQPATRALRLRRGLSADEVGLLYDDLAEPLLGWFRRRVDDRDEACDLWSETWARVVASRRRIRGASHAEHAAFVYATARNLLTDRARRGTVERRALAKLGVDPLRFDDELPERDPRTLAALAELPAEQREAVRLRVVEELDYPEIAARLGAGEAAVRQRVSRGLKAMRDRMERE